MKITNKDTLNQALANIRLEDLSLSKEIDALLQSALAGQSTTVDTEEVLNLLRIKSADNNRDS
jgi:hypothetical protein